MVQKQRALKTKRFWWRFGEEKLPDKEYFYSSVKDEKTGDNGEKLDGHISDEDYLTCK